MRKRKKLLLVMMSAFMFSSIISYGTDPLIAKAAGNPNDDQVNDYRDPKPLVTVLS